MGPHRGLPNAGRDRDAGAGFVEYAGLMILIAGIFTLIDGLGLDGLISGAILATRSPASSEADHRLAFRGDRGSTLPIYIWLTGILLFAAFAFFAFAQAASARNGAQSAADAAALAAAQTPGTNWWRAWGTPSAGTPTGWTGSTPKLRGRRSHRRGRRIGRRERLGRHGVRRRDRGDGIPATRWTSRRTTRSGDSIIPGTENKQANGACHGRHRAAVRLRPWTPIPRKLVDTRLRRRTRWTSTPKISIWTTFPTRPCCSLCNWPSERKPYR